MTMTKKNFKKRQFAQNLKTQTVAPWEGNREHIGRIGNSRVPIEKTITIKFDVIDNVGQYDNYYTAVAPIGQENQAIVEWVYTHHHFQPETHSVYLPHRQEYIS